MHLILDVENLCGEPGEGVTLAEAMDPNGKHFDCSECMKVLTNGDKHVRPPND